jgi:hypothetical protein
MRKTRPGYEKNATKSDDATLNVSYKLQLGTLVLGLLENSTPQQNIGNSTTIDAGP